MRQGALLAALLALTGCGVSERAPAAAKPQLALLTSLPIAFPEQFTLEAPAHPLLTRLAQDFDVQPVDGPEQLPPGGLLLAVQPQALTAERLVALDRWVRSGGRMVLLADPALAWESDKPLGDISRPPHAYPDTGLLRRWGLKMDAPAEQGPATRLLDGTEVLTASPGTLVRTGKDCTVEDGGLVARCKLGKGAAVVVADADFVQVDVPGGLDGPTSGNHPALLRLLEKLR